MNLTTVDTTKIDFFDCQPASTFLFCVRPMMPYLLVLSESSWTRTNCTTPRFATNIRQASSMLDSSILHLHNLTRQFAFRSNHKHLLWSTSSLRLIGSCSTWNSAWPGTIFNWRRGPPFTFRLWWFEYVDTAIWQSQCKLVGFRRMSGNNKRMYPQAVLIN